MAYNYVIYEKKERIAYVTLNRPEVMNALHLPAHEELWGVWCDFRDDPEVWVAILTGAGERAFSVGNDLKYQAAHGGEPNPVLIPGGFGGITNRFDCNKPIIAAVNGYALGGGFEIALACDIIIAAEHARFGLPEPSVGLAAGAGGVHRLPRQVPLKVAMGMMLTGRHITAEEAYRIGLVNEIVPLNDLIPCAERWAQEILRCAPLAVRATKEGAMKGLDIPLEVAMNNNYYIWQVMRNSEDFIKGPKAFAEKRPPQWKGR
ncbi:enoyl-CoA hydratase-related protein [Chloroflexota bacterium]